MGSYMKQFLNVDYSSILYKKIQKKLSSLMCFIWGIHLFLSPPSLNLKGRKRVGRNILPQRKINTNNVHFPQRSPFLKWELGSSNTSSLPVFCTQVRVKISQMKCALLEVETVLCLMDRLLPLLRWEPQHPRWKYLTTLEHRTFSCPSQKSVLGRTYMILCQECWRKCQGRQKAGTSLQRDPGVLGLRVASRKPM